MMMIIGHLHKDNLYLYLVRHGISVTVTVDGDWIVSNCEAADRGAGAACILQPVAVLVLAPERDHHCDVLAVSRPVPCAGQGAAVKCALCFHGGR